MIRCNFLQLKHGEGKVIEPFLWRLYAEDHPKTVFWVSPWMSHLDFRIANTQNLFSKLGGLNMNLTVITRKPDPGSDHEEFVRDAKTQAFASVYYMPSLHAKFYVVCTPDRRYALLGSANMYHWSARTFEIGVVIEARGEGEILVDALEDLAIELRLSQETILA